MAVTDSESRDPRKALIRRITRVEFVDDALPADWWQNLALVLCHSLIVGSAQPILQRFLPVSANDQPDFLGVTEH
jgi:hypothetical protein